MFLLRPIKLALAVTAIAAVVVAAGCGSKSPATAPPTATPVAGSGAILTARVRPTTFVQARAAVLALYRNDPAIERFAVQDVEYTPATRDKVLSVCHQGGPEKSARALESARVLACAPLIFFLYSYGRKASSAEAVDAAERLYWYAVTSNRRPYDARPGLVSLLRGWGIR